MKKLLLGCVVAFTTFGLTACSSTPDCDDGDVKDLLTQLAKENKWVSKNAKLKYDAFITQFRDKDTKQVICKARVTINGSQTKTVDYTAQYTDDGQLYVEALLDD